VETFLNASSIKIQMKQNDQNYGAYEKCQIGIDPVILTIISKKLHIFLKIRESQPFKDKLELPGILLLKNEESDTAIKRKLSQEFATDVYFTQFATFTNPNRDPRTRIISIGYVAIIPAEFVKDRQNWHPITQSLDLAFDHAHIVKTALTYLKNNITTLITKQFLPIKFPLNDLQNVYEVLEEKMYDNRNFRRKMLQENQIIETDEYETNVSHRPAKLYQFS
jgi:8-oxo-dGTP diphosphatase